MSTQFLQSHARRVNSDDVHVAGMMGESKYAWLWLPTLIFAAVYPLCLKAFHNEYIANGMDLWATLALALAYSVPAFALFVAWRLGGVERFSTRTLLARRVALFAVAAPPAFTLLGVLLYLMKISNADVAVWIDMWIAIAIVVGLSMLITDPATAASPPTGATQRIAWLRHAHGWSAAIIVVVFLGAHLINHLIGLLGSEAHLTTMKMLRQIYRNRWIEPTLIYFVSFQVLSGLVLWRPKTAEPADFLATLQTASGAYLAVYLASHVNSVFVLARHFGIDTTWDWALGAPVGLLADSWNIRLLPHYSLAVFMLQAHLACGLRVILRAHRGSALQADRITWALIGLGLLVALAISAALVGVRVV